MSYLNNVEILAQLVALNATVEEIKDAMVSKTALIDVLNTIASNTNPA